LVREDPLKDILRLLKLARPFAGTYATAMTALVIGSVAFLLIPNQLGRLIASLQSVEAGGSGKAAGQAAIMGAALLALNGVASLVYTFLASLVSERIVNQLRARFFSNLVNQRLDQHPPKALGQIASEFASDLSLVQDGLSTSLIDCVRHGLVTAGSLIALFLINFRMTLLAMVGVGGVALVIILFIRRATASIVSIQQWRSKVMALLLESAANAYIIQAYGRADYMSARFTSRLNEMYSRVWRQMLLMSCMNPVCLVLFAVVMTGLGMYGMKELRVAHLTIAMLISYFTFAAVMVAAISQVGYLGGRLRQAGAILVKHERMLAIEAPHRVIAGQSGPRPIRAAARQPFGFEIRDVTFTYPGKEVAAVSDISFRVPAGKVTAIVGESGSGKSTMAAMLCGLYQPQSGSIRPVGGEADLNMEAASAGVQIAMVPQEPFLFAGTILENITFGREDISQAQAQRAADAARIHDFISMLPDGYNTNLEEAGKNLSRGQRQRIAIARALVGDPKVIILDEATASLDVTSERAIKAVIDELRGSVTFVIIAHQGALLSDVDTCVTLKCGTLVSIDSHPTVQVEAGGVLC
jgi:ATP-binding cassette, subfamily B, bacterial